MEIINAKIVPPENTPMSCATDLLKPPHTWEGGGCTGYGCFGGTPCPDKCEPNLA